MTNQPTPPTTGAVEHAGPIEFDRDGNRHALITVQRGASRPVEATAADLIAALTANPQLRAAVLDALGHREETELRVVDGLKEKLAAASVHLESYSELLAMSDEKLRLAESQLAEVRTTFEEEQHRVATFPGIQRQFEQMLQAIETMKPPSPQQPAPSPVERDPEVPACPECRSRERGYKRQVPLYSGWMPCPNAWHLDSPRPPGAPVPEDDGTNGVAPSRGEIGAPSGAEPPVEPTGDAGERVTHEQARGALRVVRRYLALDNHARALGLYIDRQVADSNALKYWHDAADASRARQDGG